MATRSTSPLRSGLWDRARLAVHAQIADKALDLFVAQGFDGTTIDQIAEAAGISRRSFFRYFGTKEDAVFGDVEAAGLAFAASLAARPPDEDPWLALSEAAMTLPDAQQLDERSLAVARLIDNTPALKARSIEKHLQWRELLIPILEARMGISDPTGDPSARAIVSAALACLDTAVELWARSHGAIDLVATYDQAVEAVRA